jgi:hypothetical protein
MTKIISFRKRESLHVFFNIREELSVQWHPTKNGNLSPLDVTSGSTKKVWWKCPDCSFDWKCRINERTQFNKNPRYCPKCTIINTSKQKRLRALENTGSLAKLFPEVAKEWHPTKNDDLTPDMITPTAHEKPWWKCEEGHEWQANLSNRAGNNTICPYCAKKLPSKDYNLKLLHPDIVKEWNYELNDKSPEHYTPSTKRKVWWNCKYDHPYEMQIQTRTRKGKMQSCPEHKLERQVASYKKTVLKKAGSISEKRPELLNEWNWNKNKGLNPDNLAITSIEKVWWKCKRNHEWQAVIQKRTIGNGNGHGQNCPQCNNKTSHLEVRIYSELKFFFPKTIWQHPFHGGHLDIFMPDYNLAVEVDGFWHENHKPRDLKKNEQASKDGITLIRIRDPKLEQITPLHIIHDWRNRGDLQTLADLFNLLLNELQLDNSKKTTLADYIRNGQYVNEEFYLDTWANNTDPKPGHSLAERAPEMAKDWHPTANGKLTPNEIPFSSSMKVYWLCGIHGKWKSSPNTRSGNTKKFLSGCPKCGKKRGARIRMMMAAEKHSVKDVPQLIKQWHPTKNTEFTPEMVSPGSSKIAWWKCKKGHEWKVRIVYLYRHFNEATRLDIFTGCPSCYKNDRKQFADEIRKIKLVKSGSMLDHYPEITKIWHKENKFKPSELSKGSNKKVKLTCPNNHIIERTLDKITHRLITKGDVCCNECKVYFKLQ